MTHDDPFGPMTPERLRAAAAGAQLACGATAKVPGSPAWTAHCQLPHGHDGLHRYSYPVADLADELEGTVTLEWSGDWTAMLGAKP